MRLAFCCYCNSVIPHCWRPNGGQGVGFCCVCTLCGWRLAYPSCTQVNAFLPACLLYTSSPAVFPQTLGHHGCPLTAKLPSLIHCCDGGISDMVSPQEFYHRQGVFSHATSASKQASQMLKQKSNLAEGGIFEPRRWWRHCDKAHQCFTVK